MNGELLKLSYYWSREFLSDKFMLWSLFWINLLGTAYGYYWYWNQLVYTVRTQPLWFTVFVPDSPTASLFFTLSLAYLLYDRYRPSAPESISWVRSMIEALGVVASVKYGIWAVAIILWSAVLGSETNWQDWMLTGSHLGMAAEALLFMRLYRFRWLHLVWAGVWILLNDFMDYSFGIFPWLPQRVEEHLHAVRLFTTLLSYTTLVLVSLLLPFNRKKSSRKV